jgi:hypothetical protein
VPLYVSPRPSADLRRATNGPATDEPGGVDVLSGLASGYALQRQGIETQSAVAVQSVKAGDIFTTAKGDFVRVQETRVSSDGRIVEVETLKVDTGLSTQALVPVVEDKERYGLTPAEQDAQVAAIAAYNAEIAGLNAAANVGLPYEPSQPDFLDAPFVDVFAPEPVDNYVAQAPENTPATGGGYVVDQGFDAGGGEVLPVVEEPRIGEFTLDGEVFQGFI